MGACARAEAASGTQRGLRRAWLQVCPGKLAAPHTGWRAWPPHPQELRVGAAGGQAGGLSYVHTAWIENRPEFWRERRACIARQQLETCGVPRGPAAVRRQGRAHAAPRRSRRAIADAGEGGISRRLQAAGLGLGWVGNQERGARAAWAQGLHGRKGRGGRRAGVGAGARAKARSWVRPPKGWRAQHARSQRPPQHVMRGPGAHRAAGPQRAQGGASRCVMERGAGGGG